MIGDDETYLEFLIWNRLDLIMSEIGQVFFFLHFFF